MNNKPSHQGSSAASSSAAVLPFSAFSHLVTPQRCSVCSCTAQEWGGDGIWKLFCELRTREDQEQSAAWQKASMDWKTDTQNISLEASKHETFTPQKGPHSDKMAILGMINQIFLFPHVSLEAVKNHLQHYKCTSDTKEKEKGLILTH